MFEGWIELNDARLWAWDTGGDGVPLVLCHPRSQSCQIWHHQRVAFAEAGLRVIAYSRRGVYRSDPVDPAAPASQVADLAGLLDKLGIDAAHLLGAAAGGITATGFAVAHPERVRKLILAGTIVSPDEDDWRALYARLSIRELKGVVATEFLELGPSYRASEPDGTARFAELEKLAIQDKPGPAQPLGAHVTWSSLERLSVPTLLLTGEADLYAPPPLMEMVARHLEDHRLETMRAIGHAPYWEAPDDFNRLVLEFIAAP